MNAAEPPEGWEDQAFARLSRLVESEPEAELVPTVEDADNPTAAAKEGDPYAMTDLGNAERLRYWHGDKIRWDVSRNCWRFWDGKRWATDCALRVNALAHDTARRIRKEAAVAPSSKGQGKDIGAALFGHAVKSESRDRLAAMVEVAKSIEGVAVSAEMLDADTMVLNVANGTIDLRTGILRPHRREDLLTKIVNIDYQKGVTCERWSRFLSDATGGDVDTQKFLQTFAGYTATGSTVEEKLAMVYGPEATGKSVFLETIKNCLGEYAVTIDPAMLTKAKFSGDASGPSPELARLAGARLAAGSEMEQGKEFAEALVKNVTGGESITARHLKAEFFDFRPQFKIWLAVNHCPKANAEDGAIWRRVIRIGFDHTVPAEKRDKTLKPYLRNSTGGAVAVLAWIVEGCMMWQRDGLVIPNAVAKSTAAYRTESDPLATFIEGCLTFHPLAWTSMSEITKAYNEDAEDNGIPEKYRVSTKRITERLKSRGCEQERRHEGRGWRGVEVKNSDERVACVGCDKNSGCLLSEENTRDLTQKALKSDTPDTEPELFEEKQSLLDHEPTEYEAQDAELYDEIPEP